jgi:creatinine amidohydrolase
MTVRPWILSELTLKVARETPREVAVLPWGSTEPHNLHLPYGTDTIETERIAAEAARIAWERGAAVVVLPAVPFGANAQQLDIALTLNLNPSTQAMVLADIVHSLEAHEISKLLILNGHGGNDFRQVIRELQPDTEVFICTANWYSAVPLREYFDEPGDHAGEMETSLIMHVAPELALPLSEAGPGRARGFRLSAIREGWVWAPRHWPSVTDDTGVGDPSRASAEKGARYFAAVTQRIAEFIVELDAADPDDLYE